MKSEIQEGLNAALILVANAHKIPAQQLNQAIEIERCKDPAHGDFASNMALKYARIFKMNPRQLADELVVSVPIMESVAGMEVAGPGFINIRLSRDSMTSVLERIVDKKSHFGEHVLAKPDRILIEFVSANPTGPLHVGHGRGAAYGDSLANLLKANGHHVEKEYYVNNAGRQMDILALSVYWRYLQLAGFDKTLPKGIYQGDYVIDIARTVLEGQGKTLAHDFSEWEPARPEVWTDAQVDAGERDAWIDAAISAIKALLGEGYEIIFQAGLTADVADIREDLEEFGVTFDRWFSEKSLYVDHQVEKTLQKLDDEGFLYEKEGAIWFRATEFGDEKDRVVRRDNGTPTYFASDISYHLNKYERGYDQMIDIFGADHHGYMARVRASLAALGLNPAQLTIQLVQFAVLYRGGEKVQMSTRSGEFVTLRELRKEVGSDAARYFYVMRKPEQHMDFDLDLAVSSSKDNPFYYVEYAHARASRILENAKKAGFELDLKQALAFRKRLNAPEESAIITQLTRYPELIQAAGEALAPHMLINYLKDLATVWHQFYDAGLKVLDDDEEIRQARLLLTWCVGQVLRNGLAIVGVDAKERM